MKTLEYRTLTEALMAAPPDRPFITMYRGDDDITTVTFGEFIQQARRQAASLVVEGVQPGDRVVLIMPQGIQVMATFAAAMLVGAIPTILAYPNFKIEPSKYRYGLAGVTRNLKARLTVIDEKFPDDLLSHVTVEDAKVIRAVEGVEAGVSSFRDVAATAGPDSVHSALGGHNGSPKRCRSRAFTSAYTTAACRSVA